MEGKYRNNPYINDQDDPEYSPEYSQDSPRAATVSTSNSSPKTSRRVGQKRVVSVPIRDVEGSRLKGETPPPSDSWVWRKYGQKPIKGSPYPRGYYRCSSSKGCPARKQVEKSRADPTMLVVTYSCEHNHPWPASKNSNSNNNNNDNSINSIIDKNIINNNNNDNIIDKVKCEPTLATTTVAEVTSVSTNSTNSSENKMVIFDNQFVNMAEDPLLGTYELKWFSDFESTSSTMLDSPIIRGSSGTSGGGAVIFPMGEEDESLFADLGELPECSVVFRRGILEDQRRCSLPPWCGTTG